MSSVSELSEKEFPKFIKSGSVLVDFYADWCMPCKMMAPVIDELSGDFKGKIKFGKINIDENSDVAQKYGIMSIPNFILFRDGKQVHQFIGATPAEKFRENLKKFA